MPVIYSNYKTPLLFRNSHLHTIFPYLLRSRPKIKYSRTRINTKDGDFLDLDFLNHKEKNKSLVIICHGLESNSETGTEASIAKILYDHNYDILAMNYRACSGEDNKLIKTYHSGKSEDLREVIDYVLNNYDYEDIYLVGISIGGNIVLKYLGEESEKVNPKIRKAVALSAPIDLTCSAEQMAKEKNYIYMKRFLLHLYKKMKIKAEHFPDKVTVKDFHKIKNFHDFDEKYTAPLNGFNSAEDYWTKASSKPYLRSITTPTLMLSSEDDTFLGKNCYPVNEAMDNQNLFLEITEFGGHVGFIDFNDENIYYHERRILEFFNQVKYKKEECTASHQINS